jgi:hypothetical protein
MNSFEWFDKITGFAEKKWNYQLETLPSIITNNMGEFETKTILELKNIINGLKRSEPKKLKVILRRNKNKENENFFDTSALQFNSQNGTLFQVASNFNCHELGSPQRNVFSGKYITQLMVDCTQGPAASGGAVFGAFLRVAKHKEKEIDLLENTSLKHSNGKLYNSDKITDLKPEQIKIGLHTNVMASFCRTDYHFEYNPKGSIIDQVFTSTCIIDNRNDRYYNLAEILLEKAYEGTYLAGIIRKSPKIVLTLIGGGTFNNPMNIIVDKIIKIHNLYSEFLPKDCEVVLPVYEPNRTDIENIFKNKLNVDIVFI